MRGGCLSAGPHVQAELEVLLHVLEGSGREGLPSPPDGLALLLSWGRRAGEAQDLGCPSAEGWPLSARAMPGQPGQATPDMSWTRFIRLALPASPRW